MNAGNLLVANRLKSFRRATQLVMGHHGFEQPFVLLQLQHTTPELALHSALQVRHRIRG
jgi:hypothetical protein